MNIKTKLILGIGMLAGMIILLVTLSVVNLQILTATEPDSPAAMPGLERALLWISITGSICILTGLVLLYWLPRSISKPIKELKEGILEIADHNYEKRLNMDKNEEFREVADSFNRMAERLTEYRASTLSDILSAKKFIEAIVNSIDDPVIGLNMDRQILFINEEALNVLNGISNRNAQWYYYSAAANYGMGNNIVAMQHAQQAAAMEPNNPEYANMVNQMQWRGQRYQNTGYGYGRQSYGTGNLCCDLWCADTLCECMGGDLCTCM